MRRIQFAAFCFKYEIIKLGGLIGFLEAHLGVSCVRTRAEINGTVFAMFYQMWQLLVITGICLQVKSQRPLLRLLDKSLHQGLLNSKDRSSLGV